ncbi:DNA-binding protein [Flavobacterium psychrolimnae]|uniref:DNA-binding protein n=2 Tax=Flavobacterium psychrolimnae TaxID=249351 RepID=A0A366B6L6_9FLAO|nr:DNA-binding protein [Flavobacterium psychrolimnae]
MVIMNNQIFLQGITIEQLAEVLKSMLAINPQEQAQPANPLLTRDEVCELLSFNKTSLWKHTKSGRLKSYGIGNRVYYKRDEVLEAVKPINS